MARKAARELTAIRSIMQRYGLNREEAEMALDRIGGIESYLKKFGVVDREEYDRNSTELRGALKAIKEPKRSQTEAIRMLEDEE